MRASLFLVLACSSLGLCHAEDANPLFQKGLEELHNFEYDDSREDFIAARKADPQLVMAYWGEAMTYNHPLWMQQDRDAAAAALNRIPAGAKAPSNRDQGYLDAVRILYGTGDKAARDAAYEEAMRKLYRKYPNDDDVASFYALSILGATEGKRDYSAYMRAGAVLEEVFARSPKHPGAAHYLIHSYDDPVHAPLGLRPARVYAGLAPAAEHAQHMPSHIFLALGMWDETTASNEVSWDVAEKRVVQKKLGVEELGYHALGWLEYSYLQQGRYQDARKTVAIAEENAGRSKSPRVQGALNVMRATYLAETGQWTSPILPADKKGLKSAATGTFVDGVAAVETGRPAVAERALDELRKGSKDDQVMADELEARLLMSKGDVNGALGKAKAAAVREDTLNFEFGPPFPVIPAHEYYGELLLRAGKPAQAMEEFKVSLERAPGRSRSLLGLARAAAADGKKAEAKEALAKLKQNWHRADSEVSERAMAEFRAADGR